MYGYFLKIKLLTKLCNYSNMLFLYPFLYIMSKLTEGDITATEGEIPQVAMIKKQFGSLTEDEATEILLNRKKISKEEFKLFGKENIDELERLVDGLLDLDMLFLSGGMPTPESMSNYCGNLPEYHNIREQMIILCDSILVYYCTEQRIKYIIDRCFNKNGSLIVENNYMLKVIRTIQMFFSTFMIFDFTTLSNALLGNAMDRTVQCLSYLICEFMSQNNYPDSLTIQMYNCLQRIPSFVSDRFDLDKRTSINKLLDFIALKSTTYKQHFNKYQCYLRQLLNLDDKLSDEEVITEFKKKYSEEDINKVIEKYDEIEELYASRRINDFKVKKKDFTYSFKRCNDFNRPITICEIDISLNNGDISKPFLSLRLDRSMGVFFVSQLWMAMGEVLGPVEYYAICNEIYDILLEYLRSKEPDIIEFLKPEQIAQEIHEEVTKTQNIEVEEYELPHEKIEEESIQKNNEPQQEDKREKNQLQFYLKKLKNLSGTTVLRIIKNLLGEPIRISGSHHVFEASSGIRFPIALHGNKKVGIGMLLNFLKTLNIFEEFCEEL
jgi:predicted RNA binding protein YcfA (HicA-like mRNA interferase family)